MSFLAPGLFYGSIAVAAVVVGLHFIVTRLPRAASLPTARFVPDTRATTVARAPRPSDLLVMLLRVLLVLAAGAGLARPVLTPSRGAEARVILVDVSRSARDSNAIRDSVRRIARGQDAIVLFDSSTRVVAGDVGDSTGVLRSSGRRGSLSAALIASLRAGSTLRDRADSLELVIVSPFAREEFDAATDSIRKLWPGRASLVRVAGIAADTAGSDARLEIITDAGGPLAVTVALARNAGKGSGANGRVEWPASTRPRFAVQRAVRDTVGGVIAGDAVVVSAFARQWSYPADSLRGAEVVARWVDGEPAAIEKPDVAGCVRSVAVPVSPVGDLVIRRDFIRFVTTVSRACAATTSLIPAEPDVVGRLEGNGGLAPRDAFQPTSDAHSALAPWLFALAIAAAIAELFARRRRRDSTSVDDAGSGSVSREVRAA